MGTPENYYESAWIELQAEIGEPTPEQKCCIGDAEDNANDTAFEEGFEHGSERWYQVALNSYEFLMDAGLHADE